MVICLIGEPATGKTTLMKSLINELGPFQFADKPFSHHYNNRIIVLGKYDKGLFQGTDKLSMAVQPLAIEFVRKHQDKVILLEGDRLGNLSFFKEVKQLHQLHIVCLRTEHNTQEIRHITRNDTQTEQFKKAKRTKISNILEAEKVSVFNNNNYKDMSLIKQAILERIYKK